MPKHVEYEIRTKLNLLDMIRLFKKMKPELIAIDTETDGLNIKMSKPFLFQFGWQIGETIYSFVIDTEEFPELGEQTVLSVYSLAYRSKYMIGHNIKFDLHMLMNFGIEYKQDNLCDTMVCIRLAHDALTAANGGPPLSLKPYATQYISRDARLHEHGLDLQRSTIAKNYNMLLIISLKRIKLAPRPGYKSWTKGALEDLFKDVLSTYKNLPEELQPTYLDWYNTLPIAIRNNMTTPFVEKNNVPYTMLNRESVKAYGHMDIYYTLCVYYKTIDVISARKNEIAFKIECDLIKPMWEMERCGFQINKQYILNSKEKMSTYMIQRRKDLCKLVGQEVAVGRHPLIKSILYTKWGLEVPSTGADKLDVLVPSLKKEEKYKDAVTFIETVQELRTLEKWYSTYLLRFINEMRATDRIYTQINQVGAVSGRVTSDFQQFPKYGIKDKDDNELFDPRKMVIVSKDEGFIGLGYLDYSQIELRFQAFYTILVGHPDLNLCRAYMPYECYTVSSDSIGCRVANNNKVQFDYNNSEHIAHAYDWKWFREENNQPWTPTDVHAATTSIAFPDVDVHSDEFKKLRGKVGKRVNFAKNYGAQFNRIKQMFPDYDDETIHKIDDAYYKAFPGVKAYHQYCYDLASQSSFATNLFGVRYYGLTGHKLINTLVQGSGAYFLKLRMIAVQKYLKENKYKTRYQMNIHDEMSFEIAKGEEAVLFKIQTIMQEFEGSIIPIVAEMEVSTTTWSEKEDTHSIEDVERLLYPETETPKP